MATPRRFLDPATPRGSPPTCTAGPCAPTRAGAPACSRPHPRRPPARLPLPARRRGRLDQPARAALVRQPTLLLAGDDDPIVPLVNARIMGRLLPDAWLHVYHGGHLGLLTEAAELAPVIDRFLGRGSRPTEASA